MILGLQEWGGTRPLLCSAYSFFCWHLLSHHPSLPGSTGAISPTGTYDCWHLHGGLSPAVEARVPWVQSSSTWPQGSFGCLSLLFCHSFPFGGGWWEALRSPLCPSMWLSPACVSLHLPTPLWLVCLTFLSLTTHLYLRLSKFSGDSLVGPTQHIFWS